MPIDQTHSELELLLVNYKADLEALQRKYPLTISPERQVRFERFFAEYRAELDGIDTTDLSVQGRADVTLFRNLLGKSVEEIWRQEERLGQIKPVLGMVAPLVELLEAHRRLEPIDPKSAARSLDVAATLLKPHEMPADPGGGFRAADALKEVREQLKTWHGFYAGYDPMFTWWTEKPFAAAISAIEGCEAAIKDRTSDPSDLAVGPPCGSDALISQLRHEMVCYSPEELVEIGEREFRWCETELRRAAEELGFGSDYKAAMEHVKDLHEEPGGQPQMVKGLAIEAIEYLRDNNLLTVPPLAAETWRMDMMSPEKQKINPFFLGGEEIIVSFPTNEMSHAEKQMSMRGNNRHFSRATVQHELIPGHHMQFFMLERYKPYRSIFETCFWIEGWTLYWELLLWDLGFPRGPEDRIGMLFWRLHRCARIVFSIKYHLGQMSAQECVELLVERVGHERANAEGEVRRSFRGDYPPLYQAAYMLGGLQMMAMRKDIVGSGRMTDLEFHDAVMHENQMPLEVLRGLLLGRKFEPDFESSWRFYDL